MGTRMKAFTENIPKALIPIQGRPFLDFQLQWLARQGVHQVVICLGYKGSLIREFAGDGGRWGIGIQYVDEQDQLRGTGGAIRLALDSGVLEESFFVTYGDSFLPIAFGEIWDHFQYVSEPALMTVFKNANLWDKSNVCFDGKKVTLYDKSMSNKPNEMRYIDYGLMAFRREIIKEKIPSSQVMDLASLLQGLSVSGSLAGFEVMKRFFEIGSVQGLSDFEMFATKELQFQ